MTRLDAIKSGELTDPLKDDPKTLMDNLGFFWFW